MRSELFPDPRSGKLHCVAGCGSPATRGGQDLRRGGVLAPGQLVLRLSGANTGE